MPAHMPSPSEDWEVQHIRVIFDATDGVLHFYIRKHQEEEKTAKKDADIWQDEYSGDMNWNVQIRRQIYQKAPGAKGLFDLRTPDELYRFLTGLLLLMYTYVTRFWLIQLYLERTSVR